MARQQCFHRRLEEREFEGALRWFCSDCNENLFVRVTTMAEEALAEICAPLTPLGRRIEGHRKLADRDE